MNPFVPKIRKNREAKIRGALKLFLENRRWYVLITHGNKYQSGLPDLWASHISMGQRWIEVKLPYMEGSKFTPAQLKVFPKICASGSGVWILTAATESEYVKLFKDCNWYQYLSIMRVRRKR